MEAAAKSSRLFLPDLFRGLCVVSMICYHAMYDLVYLKGVSAPWFLGTPGYLWQQSICWCFILLSGACWNLSRRPLRHGLILVGCGALVTLVTFAAMPAELIQYGVLTLLGLSSLLLIPLDKLFRRIRLPAEGGLALSAFLFLLLRGVPQGGLGFEGRLLELPPFLYGTDVAAVLGLHSPAFVSSDYFPLIPWFFLYLTGYFLWKLLSRWDKAVDFLREPLPLLLPVQRFFAWIGRHSLLLYLLHQPLLVVMFALI